MGFLRIGRVCIVAAACVFLPVLTVVAGQAPEAAQAGRITLDIKGMEVVDVLQMLASRAGLNIVVGKNVAGRVTLFLKDVDVRDAFDLVLLSNELAFDEKGGIINIMTQREYELLYGERFQDKKQARIIKLKYVKAQEVAKSLNLIKSNIGRVVVDEGTDTISLIDSPAKLSQMEEFINSVDMPVRTEIFSLDYGQADKVSAKIQESVTKGVGSVRIDERTNKIVVTDYAEKLKEIGRIIKAFDERASQVLIDAQIIEIKPSDKFEMGVDWDYWIEKHFRITQSLPIGTDSRLLIGTPSVTPTGKGDYKAVVDLLRTIGDTKILSSPRIMVLNNQEAKIHVGTKDAYITSSISQAGTGTAVTSQTVNFVDTGIKLFVTPTIASDGFVTMKIRPEVSSAVRTDIKAEDQVTQVPIVTTSEAETTIMIRDGVTVIIGGLKKEQRVKTVKKIPLAGDIPGLGFLFRSTSDSVDVADLVILLTPHIISGARSYTSFSEIKPADGAKVNMVAGRIITEKIKGRASFGYSDTEQAEYYKYISDKIVSVASLERPAGQIGEVEVSFTLAAQGALKGEPQVASSTNEALNGFVVQCVKKAAPFVAFPAGMNKQEEDFRIGLVFD